MNLRPALRWEGRGGGEKHRREGRNGGEEGDGEGRGEKEKRFL